MVKYYPSSPARQSYHHIHDNSVLGILNGLEAWYDASVLTSLWQDSARSTQVASDGDVIGAWDDLSGNGIHLTQATTANKPTYKIGIQNALPIVRTDGNDVLYATFTNYANGAYTMVAVRESSADGVAMSESSSSSGVPFIALYHDSAGNGQLSHRDDSVASVNLDVAGGDGVPHIQLGRRSGSDYYERVDTATNTGSFSAGTTTVNTLTVGARRTGASSFTDYFTGDIAEILFYSRALSDGEIAELFDYLNTKWAVY